MISLFFVIIGIYAIFKIAWRLITLPFRLLGIGSRRKNYRYRDDTPMTEYDEFDWWQDNQGF